MIREYSLSYTRDLPGTSPKPEAPWSSTSDTPHLSTRLLAPSRGPALCSGVQPTKDEARPLPKLPQTGAILGVREKAKEAQGRQARPRQSPGCPSKREEAGGGP